MARIAANTARPARSTRRAATPRSRQLLPLASLLIVVAMLVTAIAALGAQGRSGAVAPPLPTPLTAPGPLPTATPVPTPVPVVTPAPAGYQPSFTGGPRLEIDKPDQSLGTLLYGAQALTVWKVRNVGDDVLSLKVPSTARVVEGCCPPSVFAGAGSLKPGEGTLVATQFTMHEGMGGVHQFAINVGSNDPVSATAVLRVFSNWVPPAGGKP